ncbi:MAG: DUF4258 domain-containing protein [Nitrospinales bacterium]
MDIELPRHTREMMIERNISEKWLWQTINNPDHEETGADSNIYRFKAVAEHGGRILHAVINPHQSPQKIVTVFFDRRRTLK